MKYIIAFITILLYLPFTYAAPIYSAPINPPLITGNVLVTIDNQTNSTLTSIDNPATFQQCGLKAPLLPKEKITFSCEPKQGFIIGANPQSSPASPDAHSQIQFNHNVLKTSQGYSYFFQAYGMGKDADITYLVQAKLGKETLVTGKPDPSHFWSNIISDDGQQGAARLLAPYDKVGDAAVTITVNQPG